MTPGEIAHKAAKSELVRQGYADHLWKLGSLRKHDWGGSHVCVICRDARLDHHPDMAAWDELPEERRAYFEAIAVAVAKAERERIFTPMFAKPIQDFMGVHPDERDAIACEHEWVDRHHFCLDISEFSDIRRCGKCGLEQGKRAGNREWEALARKEQAK